MYQKFLATSIQAVILNTPVSAAFINRDATPYSAIQHHDIFRRSVEIHVFRTDFTVRRTNSDVALADQDRCARSSLSVVPDIVESGV